MNLLEKFIKNIKDNGVDYYTLTVVALILPTIIGSMTEFKWGLLLSFSIQAAIGILYIAKAQDK